ncbi:MAG TPA: DUF2252 family protein [Actinomycetota bacterium]
MAECLGEDDRFDRSLTNFAERYADQNEREYQAFAAAIRSGRLQEIEDATRRRSPAFSSAVGPGPSRPCGVRSGPSAAAASSP